MNANKRYANACSFAFIRGQYLFVAVAFFLECGIAGAQFKPKTVLDGIYTSAQAVRGKAIFDTSCAVCHKADLSGFSGPPLKGSLFLDRWREFPASVLFELMRTTMPKDAQAPLPEASYLDIFAYLLQSNEIPAGKVELKPPALDRLLVGKDGPQPLPSSSQVGVVGCLTLDVGNGWFLTRAAEPFRTLDGFDLSMADLAEAKGVELGGLLFRLQNITEVPNIQLRDLEKSKVEVKGILVRQPNNQRVNVTAVKAVGGGCGE